ncbi:MAG TPA: translocation/assembly module TamB domain-containing protein, partial [Candidatus Eisenbacteria bacterium]
RFDLEWFQPLVSPRLVRRLAGRLDGGVQLSGDLERPDASGGLVLRGTRLELPGLGAQFEAPETRFAFSGRTVTLEPATIQSEGGRLEASGHAMLQGPGHRTFDLRTRWSKFPVMNTLAAKIALSGDLAVSGRFAAPEARGTLELVNSTVYLEPGKSERDVERVELTEDDLRELQERFGHATHDSRSSAVLDSARADVQVKIGPNVWVRRRSDPILALEMTGAVRAVKQPPDSLRVSGRLDVKTGRSYVSFLSRRFDLTQARIDLPGPLSQASAEIEALYKGDNSTSTSGNPPDVTATVTVGAQGTQVDLQSTPYMDHASLLNYLATGQTQGEMASGTAYGLAVGSVLGAVGGQAGRSLGLQVVQVTQDAYGGQTLSAGSYVEPRLYLGFRQPVVEGQHTNARSQPTSYSTEFEVELETGRSLLLNLQGGGSQYRFLVRPRLGK